MDDKFSKLDPEHKLFRQLLQKKPIWWQNIVKSVKNKTLYVEIRKDNYIDVYYNGGAILNCLSYTDDFRGEIHFQYIPLASQRNYVPLAFLDNNIEIDMKKGEVDFAKLDNFSEDGIKAFQKRIGQFFPPSSEKGIQADFVLKNSAFLDTEFQYKTDKGSIRFDLVWVDVELSRLFVVELKTIGDPRLYFNEDSRGSQNYDKIDAQLKKYREFIREQNQNLLSHYERLFIIKKKLGILPDELQKRDSLSGFAFEERPILLIADCVQRWIDDNRSRLDEAIKDIAYGCFYQGKNTREFKIPKKSTVTKSVWP
jgi:hypothetical protein